MRKESLWSLLNAVVLKDFLREEHETNIYNMDFTLYTT